LKKIDESQVLVAHACNPNYSGGRDQKDRGSKPAWASNLRNPVSKKPSQKRPGVAQRLGPVPKKKMRLSLNEPKIKLLMNESN
jgi:hypothetical protein